MFIDVPLSLLWISNQSLCIDSVVVLFFIKAIHHLLSNPVLYPQGKRSSWNCPIQEIELLCSEKKRRNLRMEIPEQNFLLLGSRWWRWWITPMNNGRSNQNLMMDFYYTRVQKLIWRLLLSTLWKTTGVKDESSRTPILNWNKPSLNRGEDLWHISHYSHSYSL